MRGPFTIAGAIINRGRVCAGVLLMILISTVARFIRSIVALCSAPCSSISVIGAPSPSRITSRM
jgi:hypothetical protein